MKKLSKSIGLILLLFISPGHAVAMNGINITVGTGEESTTRYGISLERDWERKWFAEREWYLSGYWEVGIGYWEGDKGGTGNDSVTTVSLIPVFRLQPQRPLGKGVWPYIDLAIGFYLLSDTTIGDKNLSTSFQFGDHIGAGIRFGGKKEFEIGYRFEHLSNAGIKSPNPGINFHLLRLIYRF